MNFKKLTCGFLLPEIGFGTWTMGGELQKKENYDEQKDIQAIKYALEQGITHFDTAEIYAQGYSEEILGKAIKNYPREKISIASKVEGEKDNFDDIIDACESSLKRVGINYFDIYYIHRKEDNIDLKEIMRALDYLIDIGKIKHIGVCNFNIQSLREAQKFSKHKIVVNQVHYNLIYREPEHSKLLEYCQTNDIFLMAWRPLEYGNVTLENEKFLGKFVDKYNKTYNQVSLNWLISQKNVVTIFKSTNPKHIDENLGALGWSLEKEDIEKMRNNFPETKNISNAVALA